MRARTRIVAVVVAAVLLGAVAVGYTVWGDRPAAVAQVTDEPVTLDAGRLLVVTDRRLSAVAPGDPGGPRTVSAVGCVRAYASAGTGICLRQRNAWAYQVVVLDARLREKRAFDVAGLPNRARVSASGRMVAWTTFVGGDSYTSSGFSTRTGILDTVTGATVASLEEFRVTLGGRPYRNADVNFWGVTFGADDQLFYASMSTGGRRYLVRGNVTDREVTALRENVECPSLSPEGDRIAFKEAVGGDPRAGWRLSVLDLATMRVTATAETASVDDQAAWLDGTTLAYTLRGGDGTPAVWTVPADGTGRSRLLIPGAESPSPAR